MNMRRWVCLLGMLGLLGMPMSARGQTAGIVDTSVASVVSMISRVDHPDLYNIKYSLSALHEVQWTLQAELRVHERLMTRLTERIEEVERRILELEKQVEGEAGQVSVTTLSSLELLRQNCLMERQRLEWEATANVEIASQEEKQRTQALEAKLRSVFENIEVCRLENEHLASELVRAKQLASQGLMSESQLSALEVKQAARRASLKAMEDEAGALRLAHEGQLTKLALLTQARELKSEKLASELKTLTASASKVRGLERMEAEIQRHRRRLESLHDRWSDMEQVVDEKRNLLEIVDAAIKGVEAKKEGD